MKRLIVVALLVVGSPVFAQSSAAKKDLVAKVLLLQQPGIERSAIVMAERPAAAMMQQAGMVLQTRVAPEKREALGKEIQADVKKYVDEAVPLVRERAVKLAPSTVGALLEEKFTEDELKQLIAVLESPVNRKFQQLGGEMEKALLTKLGAEMGPVIDPKLKALEQSVTVLLTSAATSAQPAASGAARAPARPASR